VNRLTRKLRSYRDILTAPFMSRPPCGFLPEGINVAKTRQRNSFLENLARLGAAHRVLQLRQEMRQILRKFPDLDAPRRSKGSPYPPNELAALGGRDVAAPSVRRKRKQRRMSAAQRKAVSVRAKQRGQPGRDL
jgi:hypothetical protein